MTEAHGRTSLTADGVRLDLAVLEPIRPATGVALLVHGFSQNRAAFLRGRLPEALVARGLTVVVGELRGHGRSERPSRWTVEDHLRLDLPCLAAAAAELGPGPPHLIAHSMGGMLGYASLAGPLSWSSLIALGAPLSLHSSPRAWLAARLLGWLSQRSGDRRLPAPLFAPRLLPVDRLLSALAGPLSERRARWLLAALQRAIDLANPLEADPSALRAVLRASDPEPMAVLEALVPLALGPARFAGVDLEHAVRRATIPVIAVVGGRDLFAPPSSVAGLTSPGHAGPRRVAVLPDASHVDLPLGPRAAHVIPKLLPEIRG